MATLRIDRAPVLTLWASVVAERLGWPHDTALTLGQAVSAMTTHVKGARPGTCARPEYRRVKPSPSLPAKSTGAICDVPLLGRIVRVAQTPKGPRALSKNALLKPEAVERYLRGEFGGQLCAALSAMERLADTVATDTLDGDALRLYEHFLAGGSLGRAWPRSKERFRCRSSPRTRTREATARVATTAASYAPFFPA